ncbi:MAG: HepT-like ribonuclease domain-containing protein [Aggregatilineales bacterium]
MKSQRRFCTHILDRIRQIERFTAEGESAFLADDRTQEAVIRCFEGIGEAVKRLDPALTAQYPMVSWRGFAGFRDVLIHQYDDVEMDKAWEKQYVMTFHC